MGDFVYEPGYLLKRNSYDSFLIMLVTDGSCSVTLNGGTASAQKGEIIFLDCYSPHQYGSQTGWEGFWLHFDGPMAREYFEEIFRLSGSCPIENPAIISTAPCRTFCRTEGCCLTLFTFPQDSLNLQSGLPDPDHIILLDHDRPVDPLPVQECTVPGIFIFQIQLIAVMHDRAVDF